MPKLTMRFMAALCNPFGAINSLLFILLCAGPIFKVDFIPCDVRPNYANIYLAKPVQA